MAMEEAMARLGRSSAVGTSARGRRLLRYAVRDLAASAFLQRYDMPSYYMTLEFDGGGLAEYRFGFEYP
ncbi:MAG: hypothetical protein JST66_00205 [Bacteroidetes bacterium]|nr:hypothetical protein [Bacteroidota bacterium]